MKPIMFADDSNFFMSGKNLNTIEKMVNEELKNIVTWLEANRLSLNIKKNKIYDLFSQKEFDYSTYQH